MSSHHMLAPTGREGEIEHLRAVIDGRGPDTLPAVFVGGEPGIGKSYLLEFLSRESATNGAVVLRSSCYEDNSPAPFGPFVDILRAIPELHNRLSGIDEAVDLSWILPDLGGVAGPGSADGDPMQRSADRTPYFDAYARVLTGLARESNVLLVLDDLHWADEPTAQLLRYLVRALRSQPVTLLGSYRDTDLAPELPFEAVLRDLQRERLASHVMLRRLALAETRSVIARVLGVSDGQVAREAAGRVHQASEGVPFFIGELVLHLREESHFSNDGSGVWTLRPESGTFLPPGVRSVVGHRLARLSNDAREILGMAAVIGKEFSPDLLLRVMRSRSTHGEDILVQALDDAISKRLIVERFEPASRGKPRYQFAHEQIREVLYRGMNAIRRRALHEAIGRELEVSSAVLSRDASRLAYHFSNGEDLQRALMYTRMAGEEAARVHAYEEALRYFDAAIEIHSLSAGATISTPTLDAALLIERDRALRALGRHEARRDGISRLLRLAKQDGDTLQQFKALLRASGYYLDSGETAEAVASATEALALGMTLDDRARMVAEWTLAEAYAGRESGEPSHMDRAPGDLMNAAQHLASAREIADRLGQRENSAWITQELGVVLWELAGQEDVESRTRARTFLVEALEGFRETGNRKGEVTALISLAYRRPVEATPASGSTQGTYVAFLEEIRRLRKTEHLLARESDRPRLEALSLLSIHMFCRTEGWYEIALERAGQALQWAESARQSRINVLARLGMSETEALLGRATRALEHAEQAAALLEVRRDAGTNLESQRGPVSMALARAYALLGNHDTAIAVATAQFQQSLVRGKDAAIAESETNLAELYALQPDGQDLAVNHAESVLQRTAQLSGSIVWDIRAHIILARIWLAEGDVGAALGHAAAAVSRLEARGVALSWLKATTYGTRGLVYETTGELDDAVTDVRRANEIVERTASRITDAALRKTYLENSPYAPDIRIAAQRLGLLQSDPAGAGRAKHPGGLTSREVEVLRLVAAGKTNREIADQLFISEKTVARHLTNTFMKIDSQSRTQAAAWAFRQGIA